MIREALAELVEGRDLSPETAAAAMNTILAGEATDSQIAAFAVALRMKGETVEEITGMARALRERATELPLDGGIARGDLLDTCGTGGDGAHTFNVSTTVALVAAGAGVPVAKHGNRAVSSQTGSADVLEELGLPLDLTPEQCAECLREVGVVFLFAPLYHAALRHAAGPRREMGLRTVFNVLGPLCNPAAAGRQLVGVFDPGWVSRLARVLGELGSKAACVAHSEDGLDEISVFAPTRLAWLGEGGKVREETLDPARYGLSHDDRGPLLGGDARENADRVRQVLGGEKGVARDIVLLNTAAALVAAGRAASIEEGVSLAARSIDDGKAAGKLDALIAFATRAAVGQKGEPGGGGGA
jgi:anthranilate phosphoribosyltransferase